MSVCHRCQNECSSDCTSASHNEDAVISRKCATNLAKDEEGEPQTVQHILCGEPQPEAGFNNYAVVLSDDETGT